MEGLKGLFNVLIAMGSDHDYVTLMLPMDIDMSLIFPEWSGGAASARKCHSGMVRVINVETALKGARYMGSGEICLSINDKQIEENNSVFKIVFRDGKAVSVKKVDADADVNMGINEFSHLIIGSGDVKSLEFMDHVTIHRNADTLKQIFYRKPNMIMEYF